MQTCLLSQWNAEAQRHDTCAGILSFRNGGGRAHCVLSASSLWLLHCVLNALDGAAHLKEIIKWAGIDGIHGKQLHHVHEAVREETRDNIIMHCCERQYYTEPYQYISHFKLTACHRYIGINVCVI